MNISLILKLKIMHNKTPLVFYVVNKTHEKHDH